MKQLLTISLFIISSIAANAQTVCDSVDVISIQYSPFTDTVIIVEVENNSQWEIFDYPGFVLLNDNDDTVAVETVNYFGIGTESIHRLEVRSGVHNPQDIFSGSLKLYSDFYGTFECEWVLNQSLCASTPCETVYIGLQNFGGALVIGDFHWRVDDESGMVADSGSFTMEVQEQFWLRDLCLPPGNYTYSLTALTNPSGGGPTLTVQSSIGFASPTLSEPLDWFNNPGGVLEFPFFNFCGQTPNSTGIQSKNIEVEVLRNGSNILLNATDILKSVSVFGMDGKLAHFCTPNAERIQLPSDLYRGVYLIRIETERGSKTIKVFI